MRVTYDPRHTIAYLALREKTEQAETLRISGELNVDLAPDGTIYGIELLNANDQLRSNNGAGLTVANEASGRSSAVRLRA